MPIAAVAGVAGSNLTVCNPPPGVGGVRIKARTHPRVTLYWMSLLTVAMDIAAGLSNCYSFNCYTATLLYSSLLYSTLLYSTLLFSILLYSTLLYSSLLYSTLLYSTLLYSTLLYSTVSLLHPNSPVHTCTLTDKGSHLKKKICFCLVMLQRESQSNMAVILREKFDFNVEVRF